MFKLITNCGLSGVGIFLSIKNIKKSKSSISKCLNAIFIIIYSIITVLSIGRIINKKKTKEAIDSFSK